jgi:SHS2 domain-containing protein
VIAKRRRGNDQDPERASNGAHDDEVLGRRGAWHEAIPHTADTGFKVVAGDLRSLFSEAGTALIEVASEVAPGTKAILWRDVRLSAADLPALAFAWLNELISLADLEGGAVVATDVIEVADLGPHARGDRTSLRGRVGLRPFADGGVRVLREPKSATYHGLTVTRFVGGWELRAFVDL